MNEGLRAEKCYISFAIEKTPDESRDPTELLVSIWPEDGPITVAIDEAGDPPEWRANLQTEVRNAYERNRTFTAKSTTQKLAARCAPFGISYAPLRKKSMKRWTSNEMP